MTWTQPPELGGLPPRPVRLTRTGIVLVVVAAGILIGGIAIGVKLAGDSGQQNRTIEILQAQGTETEATVKRLWRTGKNQRTFRVSYEFAMGGRVFHGDARVERSLWQTLSEGSLLRVRYLPADPMMNRPAESANGPAPEWLAWALPAMFGLVSVIMVSALRRQKRLLEDGRAAPGTITAVRRAKQGRSITYDFTLPGGSRASGRGMAKRAAADVGAEVTVIYDPDKPGRNAPYPFDLVRLAD